MILRGLLLPTLLVVVASFVLVTVESQTVTVFPLKVGAQRGELNVLLSCNVTGLPPNNVIEWIYYPAWKTGGFTIYSTYYNVTNDPGNFTVRHTALVDGTQSLELFINTAKPELAAGYICHLTPVSAAEETIDVVVLDPLECPGSIPEYDEFNVANLSCSVNYHQDLPPKYDPRITWYRDGLEIPGVVFIDEPPTRKTAILTKNVTSVDDDQEFLCIVDFLNSNLDYSDNCSTVFYVRHAVSEIIFFPPSSLEFPTEVAIGSSINCTANGRPAPTIEWYNSVWELQSQQSELLVTEEMRSSEPITYYCRANNTIDTVMYSFENNYTFTVVDAPPVVQSGGVEAWVIAVAVIVPIVVIAAIIITVVLVVRHRKKKKKMKAKTTNGSAAARPTTTTTTTAYSAVPPSDVVRSPPTSAPRTTGQATGSITSNRGPPGPDNRNGLGGYGENPGFGDLGVQTYGGSNQAVNAYPPARSVHGSNQALGVAGVSMNPNPGYPVRSNPALNASINQRPTYPYTGSNSALNTSLSVGGPNPVAPSGASYGRQPSIASSSGRSHASSYNAAIPAMEINRYGNDLSSMHGSEV